MVSLDQGDSVVSEWGEMYMNRYGINELSKRKKIRIDGYDYSAPGSYFITVCIANRMRILWDGVGAATCRHNLSKIGVVVEKAILQISEHYPMISVDKYCIMPDHVHMILSINTDDDGRQVAAPTILTVVGHMKRWVSIQIERSIWQKSFADKIIRNDRMYRAVWEYIENNPIKMDTAYDMPDFDNL